jgi:ABC-2 type transport system permease protein
MSKQSHTRAASASAAFLVIMGGILVLLNVLGVFVHVRADATEKELFSLSNGSKRLVSSLKDRMEILAYFSEDLPPPHNATERYVRDLLVEYKEASKGKISLRFINPVKDEDKQAAEKDNVSRVQDQKLEADSFSVHEGYRGLAFHYLGDARSIAQVDDTDGLEYEITQIIKEMTGEKVKIAVLGGKNADPQPDPMQMRMGQPPEKGGVKLNSLKAYLPTYDVQEVKADKEIGGEFKALLIVQPDQPFTETELRYIDQFVMRGGSLAVFGGALKLDMQMGQPSGSFVDTGLNKLLSKWGVSMSSKVLADAQCGRARMPTTLGIPVAVPYPPVPIITFEEYQRKHPVLFRLNQTALPYASPLALNDALKGDKEVKRTILAQSTKYAWTIDGATVDLKARERWEVPKERQSYVVGVALQGKLPSAFAEAPASTPEGGDNPDANAEIKAPARAEKPVHVLVFGSGFFMRDEFLPQPQRGARDIPGGAAALALNAIDWLAQDSDLVEIRAKSVEDPTLEVPTNVKEAEATIREAIEQQDKDKADKAFEERKASMAAWDNKKATYRLGNTLGLPLAFALFGVLRWRVRKATRAKLKL